MGDAMDIEYGPLQGLIGVWKGQEGVDIAPDPDGKETNPYYEEITFSPVGGVTNAESQNLAALHYRQTVKRKADDQVFHDETGYWMWEASTETVMHSLVIPRGVGVLAGGKYSGEKSEDGRVIIDVAAKIDDDNWGIVQSPFMLEKAKTIAFCHQIIVGPGKLTYSESTTVDIYGKVFEHTDANELVSG